MKRTAILLGLFALLALVPCTQGVAQTTEPPSPDLARFLASLPGGQTSTLDAAATSFQLEVCTTHEDCPEGQLCCYPCGIDGCPFVCTTPQWGRCPFYP